MPVVLAALLYFGILTLWIPAYWPVTVFQVGVFTLTAIAICRARLRLPPRSYPLLPLAFAVLWGLLQCLTGHTAYLFVTQTATVHWAAFLAIFLLGLYLFADPHVSLWFRSAMLWFAFLVAIEATLQTFSSGGNVFWLFPSGYSDHIMGPILSRNHFAAFIEAVLPIALYQALTHDRDSLLYSGMAAALYASVIASASRAGAVLTSSEILLVVALLWTRHRASGRTIGLALLRIAVLFVLFTGVVGWESVWHRFWAPDPMAVRRELNISSLHMIAAHPLAGVGLGAWPTVYPQYAIVDIGAFANQAHNDWLQWTAEAGIPFGLLMLGLFLWSLRPALRSVWGLGVLAVFLHALVDYPFSRPALGSWTLLVLAMLASEPPRRPSPGNTLKVFLFQTKFGNSVR